MAKGTAIKQLAISAGVLLAVALLLDPRAIIHEVRAFSLPWLVLGLAISVFQVLLCAWRWRLTAGLVGVPLRYRDAVREYYLSLFINQVLPGGVLGDAGRALRHAQQTSKGGSAWRAVIIERASGQLAVGLLTALVLVSSPLWHAVLGKSGYLWLVAGGAGVALGVAVIAAVMPERVHLPGWVSAFWVDIQRGLWHGGVWAWQLVSSLMIVFSYALVMLCAARAIGVELSASTLLALAPPLLLSMLIPLSVAGWGLREGTAASVWAWVGLAPSQGVAVSLAYGIIVLIATLPGLWVALIHRRATPAGSGGIEPAQAEVKQGVVPAGEAPRARAQGRGEGVDWRHGKARATRANQQGRDEQVQSLNHAGFDELRYGNAATFDQYSRVTQRVQVSDDRFGRELPVGQQWQRLPPNVRGRVGQRYLRPDQVQRGGRVVLKESQCRRHAPTGVEHHTHGVCAADMAHGQLRVIGAGGARPHNHRIAQGAQPVQMHQTLMAVDVVGVAAFGGDAPVKALPQLSHHPRSARHQRGQAVKQLGRVGHDVFVGHNVFVEHSASVRYQIDASCAGVSGRASTRLL
jgi:uncharacterized membrane protein YbhN (UPF0104 family)